MDNAQYLTIEEVAAILRKTPKAVRKLMARGEFQGGLHYFRPNESTLLFKRDALVQWIEGRPDARTAYASGVRDAIRAFFTLPVEDQRPDRNRWLPRPRPRQIRHG